jgi:hypothetical protein
MNLPTLHDVDPFFASGYRLGHAGRHASIPFGQDYPGALLPFTLGFEFGVLHRRYGGGWADPVAAWRTYCERFNRRTGEHRLATP